MLLNFEIIWIKMGQIIRIQNDIDFLCNTLYF